MAVFRQNKSKHRFFFYANSLSPPPCEQELKARFGYVETAFCKIKQPFRKIKTAFRLREMPFASCRDVLRL